MQAHLYSRDQAEGLELSGKALSLSVSKIQVSCSPSGGQTMYQTAGPKGLYGDLQHPAGLAFAAPSHVPRFQRLAYLCLLAPLLH